MSNEQLRLECLRLAHAGNSEPVEYTVQCAQLYYDFLTGKSDQTQRQIIDAALDVANVR